MSTIRFFPLLLLAVPAAAVAQSMPVATFIAKADALQRKGPLALFSSDLKLLTHQIKADFAGLRTERRAAEAAGTTTAFCPPAAGAKLTDKDILSAMQAVPTERRGTTSTREALKTFLARRYPCN